MKRRRYTWVWGIVVLLLLAGCLSVCALTYVWAASSDRWKTAEMHPRGIAVIEISGEILYGKNELGSGAAAVYSRDLIEQVRQMADDPSIAAIVLDINSPGGSVVASVDIYDALVAVGKPVVASMGEMAASGGYYVACAADHIVARPATLTGSIGVIAQFTNIQKLATTLGIEHQTIKTGAHKDQGGLFRPMSEEEVALFQAIIDEAYDDFVQTIMQQRGLNQQKVLQLADGRVFSGRQAVAEGLVDEEGDLQRAIDVAAEMAGIEGEPDVTYLERPASLWQLLLQRSGLPVPGETLAAARRFLQADHRAQLQYLYVGP